MDSLGVTDRHGRHCWSADCEHSAPSGLRGLVPPLDHGGRRRGRGIDPGALTAPAP